MLHKKGSLFHRDCEGIVSASEYRKAVSSALAQELGGAGRAAKETARWTGASERTAKNWISETYGPTGENLIELMRHSDTVFDVVLALAGRHEERLARRLTLDRDEVAEVLSGLDAICKADDD